MIDTCQRNKSDRRMLANAQQMLEDSRKKIDLIQMQLLRAKREAQVGCPLVNFDQIYCQNFAIRRYFCYEHIWRLSFLLKFVFFEENSGHP